MTIHGGQIFLPCRLKGNLNYIFKFKNKKQKFLEQPENAEYVTSPLLTSKKNFSFEKKFYSNIKKHHADPESNIHKKKLTNLESGKTSEIFFFPFYFLLRVFPFPSYIFFWHMLRIRKPPTHIFSSHILLYLPSQNFTPKLFSYSLLFFPDTRPFKYISPNFFFSITKEGMYVRVPNPYL